MNVNYPVSVEKFLQLFGISTFDFVPNYFSGMFGGSTDSESINLDDKVPVLNPLTDIYSPSRFFENGYSGYFIKTGGSVIQLFLGVAIFYLIMRIIIRLGSFKLNIFEKIVARMEWSFCYRLWFSFYIRLTFASLLQLRAIPDTNFSNAKFTTSLVIAWFVILFSFIFPLISFRIAKKFPHPSHEDRKKYFIMIGECKENYLLNRFTFGIELCKKLFISIGVTFLYDLPYLQNIVPWSCYLFGLIFLIAYRPYKDWRINAVFVLSEYGFLVIHTIIGIYTLNDLKIYTISYEDKEYLGEVIISICISIIALKVLVLLSEMVLTLKKIFKKLMNRLFGKPDQTIVRYRDSKAFIISKQGTINHKQSIVEARASQLKVIQRYPDVEKIDTSENFEIAKFTAEEPIVGASNAPQIDLELNTSITTEKSSNPFNHLLGLQELEDGQKEKNQIIKIKRVEKKLFDPKILSIEEKIRTDLRKIKRTEKTKFEANDLPEDDGNDKRMKIRRIFRMKRNDLTGN